MILVTTRFCLTARLAAVVLLLLIAAPWTAPFATMQGTFDASSAAGGATDLTETAKDETSELTAPALPADTDTMTLPVVRLARLERASVTRAAQRRSSSRSLRSQAFQVLRL